MATQRRQSLHVAKSDAKPSAEGEKAVNISLQDAARNTLTEARMVLPGIQALFGFQLVAVIDRGFDAKLTPAEQYIHLAAMGLVAVAIALIMAPAALHRRSSPYSITRRFVSLSSRLLGYSMIALAPALALELYVIARLIAGGVVGGVVAMALLGVLVVLWFVLPRVRRP
jgi:hypothetical protein